MQPTTSYCPSSTTRPASSRISTLLAVCIWLMASIAMAPKSFAADAETSNHRLVVVNNTNSKIYFSDYTQYRRPGDLINTWNDVDSVYNDEFIGNDPDYLAPGEVSTQCGIWINSEVDPDCEAWYVDTFFRYEDMFYTNNPWTTGEPLIDSGFNVLNDLPRPFRISSVLVQVADFQWRIQYGCDSASNNEDHWPSSPTFNWETATVHSDFIDLDWPWVDYWEPTTQVVAIINDCNGDVSWGYNYWDAEASSHNDTNHYWTDWINTNDGETDAVGDTEPVNCAEPVDIQCKLVTGQEFMDRLPSLTTDTYSCDPQTGFSCTHADQADGSCGDWAVRYYCNSLPTVTEVTFDFEETIHGAENGTTEILMETSDASVAYTYGYDGTPDSALYFDNYDTGNPIYHGDWQHVFIDEFTLSFWFRAEASSTKDQWLVSFSEDGTWRKAVRTALRPGGSLHAACADEFGNSSLGRIDTPAGTNYVDGQWHHVAYVHNGNQGTKLYVDGEVAGSTNSYCSNVVDAGKIYLGSYRSAGYHLHGALDAVTIYDVALSAAEVELLAETSGDPVATTISARYNSGRCLQKEDAGWSNGNDLVLWNCNDNGDEHKLWSYDSDTGYIRSTENPSMCLHKQYGNGNWDNGNPIHLWSCNAGLQANKSWDYDAATGYLRARHNNNKCIHKKYGNWNNGNPIHLWDCSAGSAANKSWTFD